MKVPHGCLGSQNSTPLSFIQTFIVQTDHAALRWQLTIHKSSGCLMWYRLHPAKYEFHFMHKKGPRNVHANALSWFRTLVKTAAAARDEILSDLLSKQVSKHTKVSPVANFAEPTKLRYKQTCKDNQIQRDDDATYDPTCLNDMTADELIATLPDLTPANPIFEPISDKAKANAQFPNAFCVDTRCRLCEAVALSFGKIENRILCHRVTRIKTLSPKLRNNVFLTSTTMPG